MSDDDNSARDEEQRSEETANGAGTREAADDDSWTRRKRSGADGNEGDEPDQTATSNSGTAQKSGSDPTESQQRQSNHQQSREQESKQSEASETMRATPPKFKLESKPLLSVSSEPDVESLPLETAVSPAPISIEIYGSEGEMKYPKTGEKAPRDILNKIIDEIEVYINAEKQLIMVQIIEKRRGDPYFVKYQTKSEQGLTRADFDRLVRNLQTIVQEDSDWQFDSDLELNSVLEISEFEPQLHGLRPREKENLREALRNQAHLQFAMKSYDSYGTQWESYRETWEAILALCEENVSIAVNSREPKTSQDMQLILYAMQGVTNFEPRNQAAENVLEEGYDPAKADGSLQSRETENTEVTNGGNRNRSEADGDEQPRESKNTGTADEENRSETDSSEDNDNGGLFR